MHVFRVKELAVLAGMTLTYSISTSKDDTDDFMQIVPDSVDQDGVDDSDTAESFFIACPEDVVPGQLLVVTSPLGELYELAVPKVRDNACVGKMHAIVTF